MLLNIGLLAVITHTYTYLFLEAMVNSIRQFRAAALRLSSGVTEILKLTGFLTAAACNLPDLRLISRLPGIKIHPGNLSSKNHGSLSRARSLV